jgi:hypothetical protein
MYLDFRKNDIVFFLYSLIEGRALDYFIEDLLSICSEEGHKTNLFDLIEQRVIC